MTKDKLEVKRTWENESRKYNAMFDYLEKKGLTTEDLIIFAKLLADYTYKS